MTPSTLIARQRERSQREAAVAEPSVRRYHDSRFAAVAVKVFPGEHYVTHDPNEMLVTILGSCVAACIRDPIAQVGGMNHFMLPESPSGGHGWGDGGASLRYGNFAMERLINDVLQRGGARDRLEVKVFGGGRILDIGIPVGERNAAFVEAYLLAEGLPIVARHLLGSYPRRVHYFPVTGQVFMQELRRREDANVIESEVTYRINLAAQPLEGSIELFD